MLRPAAVVAMPLLALSLMPPAAGQSRPEAKDMALVGFNDLQARSAYQPTIHNQGGRTTTQRLNAVIPGLVPGIQGAANSRGS